MAETKNSSGAASSGAEPAPRELQCENDQCGRWFAAPPALIGMLVRCPHCAHELRVPGAIVKPSLSGTDRWCSITIVKGPAYLDKRFELDPKRSYTIGKSDTCEIALPGAAVSRRHASLHWVNAHWVVEDLNSANGTEVNRLKTMRQELNDGDRVHIGEFLLHFVTPRHAHIDPAKLPLAQPVPAASEALPLEKRVEDLAQVMALERSLRAEQVHFEGRKDVQASYEQAARDLRIRQVVWAAGSIVGVCVILAALGWLDLFGKKRPAITLPSAARSATRPATLSPNQPPPEFVDALREKRFGDAREAAEAAREAGNSELSRRMHLMLETELVRTNDDLLRRATGAMRDDRWGEVDLIMKVVSGPEFQRFAGQWADINARVSDRALGRMLAEIRASKEFERLLALTDDQTRQISASPALSEQIRSLRKDAGCGLLVEIEPKVPGAQLLIDQQPTGSIGKSIWELIPGKTTVAARAAGFRGKAVEVHLEPGEIRRVNLTLTPNARPANWTMSILRSLDQPAATWVAARYFSQNPSSGYVLRRPDLAVLETAARRGLEARAPRVATLKLSDGSSVTGQIWNQPGSISLRELPGGKSRSFKPEEIATTTELDPVRAARLLADFAFTSRKAEGGALAALTSLGELALQFSTSPEASNQTTTYVRDCVEELAGACAACAGRAEVACDDCRGKGEIKGQVTCDACRGARKINCPRCRGSGKAACGRCGGSGQTSRDVHRNGWVFKEFDRCTTCGGDGKARCNNCPGSCGSVTCPRCKATGLISGKDDCATCRGAKLLKCPACDGDATREAMHDEERDAAEKAALGAPD